MTPNRRRALHGAAAAVILLGALLRLDAFVGKYGTLERPGWARVLTHDVARIGAALRPPSVAWTREQNPYVGGDPITYLEYGRAMASFYQPHVREPVFLALTAAGLWLLNDQDAGISLASTAGSVLAILGVYLVGLGLRLPLAGLLASLFLAVEYEAIAWAPDGWRDDTFTAMVLFSVWSLLRLREHPSFRNALVAGALGGLVCLTRITALTFLLPSLLWLVFDGQPGGRPARLRAAGMALLISAMVLGPYLVSCAIATGDPFIALNYHTGYYRHAEGLQADAPMSAPAYLLSKLSSKPLATVDTAFVGLFVQPFASKWNGLDQWAAGAGALLSILSLGGLAAMPFFGRGRLLLVVLLTALVPYMLTWNLGGGGEWRFTMHAYPFYLLAAGLCIIGIARFAGRAVRNDLSLDRGRVRRLAVPVTGLALLAGLGAAAYFILPWFVVREAVALGEDTSIETGARDRVFYRDGWSRPHLESIIVRVSSEDRATVHFPLPLERAYDIVMRIDPVVPETQKRVSVLFNGHLLGTLRLSWNPERVGSYRLHVREALVNAGGNELTLVPDTLVPASAAGPRFAWLPSGQRLGIRLWYIRVLP